MLTRCLNIYIPWLTSWERLLIPPAHPTDLFIRSSAVPPDILDYPTSTDMVEREGSNVTLVCAARGSPKPVITWRRENNAPFTVGTGPEGE